MIKDMWDIDVSITVIPKVIAVVTVNATTLGNVFVMRAMVEKSVSTCVQIKAHVRIICASVITAILENIVKASAVKMVNVLTGHACVTGIGKVHIVNVEDVPVYPLVLVMAYATVHCRNVIATQVGKVMIALNWTVLVNLTVIRVGCVSRIPMVLNV